MAIEPAELRRFPPHERDEPDGIAFGASPRMPQRVSRRRERRTAIDDLLTALTRTLDRQYDISLMRGAFESAVRRSLRLRSVHLRDPYARWAPQTPGNAPESVALDVVGSERDMPGLLEATFDLAAGLGEWEFQLLGLAAKVGALVLEIERSRVQLLRAGLANSSRLRRDTAIALVGSTPSMLELRSTIQRIATTDFTVLVEGESGVGKELVARQIHECSRRRSGPFVAINCAALVETLLEAELFGIEERTATGVRGRRGKFEAADGGTLFLDEVSDLSLAAQAKLLRAIQDLAVERVGGNGPRRVDIRIIAATNRSLRDAVADRLFRSDLFYRLSGVDIRVPTLRERRADVIELAEYFLERHRVLRPLRLGPAAREALLTHDWPGNVRELERTVEHIVALATSDVIEISDLPAPVRGEYGAVFEAALRRKDTLRAWASRYVRLVLERCGGNKRIACDALDISYHTLNAYLRFPDREPVAEVGAERSSGAGSAGGHAEAEMEPAM